MLQKKILIHVVDGFWRHDGACTVWLNRLIDSKGYQNTVGRSIIIAPVDKESWGAKNQLLKTDEILYKSSKGCLQHLAAHKLAEIEHNFNITITYAKRSASTGDESKPYGHEILLIDIDQADIHPVNALKAWLYEEFGVESLPYEQDPNYERYVKLAPAALAALRAIGAADPARPGLILAHNYHAMPTALAAMMDPLGSFKTIFFAHNVPTMRRLIESHPGHDTMFHNLMKTARKANFYYPEILSDQPPSYQDMLIRSAQYCDHIIAAGDRVRYELKFLGHELDAAHIDIAYSAPSQQQITPDHRRAGNAKLRQYAQNLLGIRPDYIFVHTGTTAVNEAFWRDLRVMEHLDGLLQKQNKTATYFLVNVNSIAKSPEDIDRMEADWDWPVAHRETSTDLSEGEVKPAIAIQAFNARLKNIKAVFINQWDENNLYLGRRVPAPIEPADFLQAADVAFHQSISDACPIPALSPLLWGTICVISQFGHEQNAFKWVKDHNNGRWPAHLITADYTQLNNPEITLNQILAIDQQQRDAVEYRVAADVARKIIDLLPQDEHQIDERIEQTEPLRQLFTWDRLWQDLYLPAINRAYTKRRIRQIA